MTARHFEGGMYYDVFLSSHIYYILPIYVSKLKSLKQDKCLIYVIDPHGEVAVGQLHMNSGANTGFQCLDPSVTL